MCGATTASWAVPNRERADPVPGFYNMVETFVPATAKAPGTVALLGLCNRLIRLGLVGELCGCPAAGEYQAPFSGDQKGPTRVPIEWKGGYFAAGV